MLEKYIPENDKKIRERVLHKAEFFVRNGIRKRDEEFIILISADDRYIVCVKTGKVVKIVSEVEA